MPRSETEHALAQLLARLLETRLSKHTPTPTKPHAMVTSGSVHMCVYTTIDEAVESGETCLRRQPLTWMYSLHSTEGRQAGRYSVPKPRSVFSVPTRTAKASRQCVCHLRRSAWAPARTDEGCPSVVLTPRRQFRRCASRRADLFRLPLRVSTCRGSRSSVAPVFSPHSRPRVD